jgi:hypothetical protein
MSVNPDTVEPGSTANPDLGAASDVEAAFSRVY